MSVAVAEELLPEGAAAAAVPRARMGVALLALAGVLISSYMLLYKLGAIPAVACGAGSCARVQESPWSVFLGVPVPAWGVLGYGLILVLALAGVQPSLAEDRRISLGLLALGAGAFGFSVYLSALEAFVIDAWCRWCIGSAVVATLIFLLTLTELPRLRSARRG